MEEHAALSVLHRWGEMNEFISGAVPLVPEHVEIRSLKSHDNPGLPQVVRIRTSRVQPQQYNILATDITIFY